MKNAPLLMAAPARERGFLLIAAVVLIVVGAVMASTMAFLAVSGSQSSSGHVGSNQALFIADSGLERAVRFQ
jgi:type II secretory pathway component PulK